MRKIVGTLWLVVAVAGLSPAIGLAAETPTERRLRLLEEQLRSAQDEIQRLKGEVQQQKAIGQATQKQAEAAEEQVKTVAKDQKGFELPEWVKRTSLFGDVRLRYEGFYHQPAKAGTKVTARNRERIRARIGLKSTFSDELSATIRLATGNVNDPISTNQDLGNSFARKNINLDWAYMTLTPGATFGIRPGLVTVYGGKFPNPVFKPNELLWDEDLSPEGLSETFSLLAKPVGPLDQLKVHFLQWTFGEVSNGPDGWMIGGQVNPVMHFGNAQVEVGIGQYGWHNPDLIAQQLNTNSSLKNTNLTFSEGGEIAGFESGFLETNPTAQVTWPNFVGTQPLKIWADYVYNWRAATTNDSAYQAGWRIGQQKVKGDWSVYAFWERNEQESMLSEFTASDFGNGGTNGQGGQFGLEYQLLNPLTLGARSWFVNYIDTPAGSDNPTLFRVQVDAMVKF